MAPRRRPCDKMTREIHLLNGRFRRCFCRRLEQNRRRFIRLPLQLELERFFHGERHLNGGVRNGSPPARHHAPATIYQGSAAMSWIDPAYCDLRLGFEVTAYVYVR